MPASSRVLREEPGEQPGEVTSVEIRNEAGELIDGELDEGEYFLGAAPTPIRIGAPLPSKLASDSVPTLAPPIDGSMEMDGDYDPTLVPWNVDDITPMASDCESCSTGQCDSAGNCSSCGHHAGSPIDPRVEKIARILANPMDGFWARAEYMHFYLDGQNVPALVTTSPVGTARADAGILTTLGTQTLFGGREIIDGERSGGRFEIGHYFHGESGLGVSASYLFADEEDENFAADSSTFGILARPFVDVSPTGVGNNAELVAFPGELTGNINVLASTKFSAGDVLLRGMLICEPDRQLEGFVGYAYYQLDDRLTINDFKRVIGGGGGLAVGTTLDETDRFSVDNDFHGAALGVRSRTCFGGWSLASMLKLGLGVTTSSLNISGQTTSTVPLVGGGTDVATRNSGLLAQGTNSGNEDFDEFAIAPELELTLSHRMNRDWNVSVGYRLIYLSRVMRAGEQVDPLLNLSQLDPAGLTGFASPSRSAFYNDLTAQAITIGLIREF
ncbi:hypothetical protein Pla100_08450 [Neorhodopirellula pilleata]|uniref:Uncharacterized protein n=2 Tax=Neorhodopirellula pilleata TaxID=2714738 RepID=A0A5C6AVX4_9BACT|nr:hypothetical protein Pla100_08450 [Neorhodopirellula pilleata]